jgi:hypothetical protein
MGALGREVELYPALVEEEGVGVEAEVEVEVVGENLRVLKPSRLVWPSRI